jgi:hypothetical protein
VTENEPPQLDYAQPTPWLRRRSSRRVALLLFAIIALGFGMRWGSFLVERVQANYWFAKCMGYDAPADRPVYEPRQSGWVTTIPEPWTKFSLYWGGSSPMTGGTLFLHERRTRAGERRLIAVDAVSMIFPRTLQLQANVFGPAIGMAPAQRKSAVVRVLNFPFDADEMRIYAGQPDPADASHFTMRYEIGNRHGLIDGWLRDDDTVVIEPREQSPTQPAPSSPATSPSSDRSPRSPAPPAPQSAACSSPQSSSKIPA